MAAGMSIHAATLGHARVVSAYGEPLQVMVPLTKLTEQDKTSLKVTLADAAAWARAGLTPPVPLDSLELTLQSGTQPDRKIIRLQSSQALQTSAVDLLLDLLSNEGQRQVQVTILVPQRSGGSSVQPARVGNASSDSTAAGGTVTVRAGDNLFRIARRHAVANASDYQMLVAIWRANPHAFINNNLHLVRAGAELTIPAPDTVRAISATQARQLYLEQTDAFARYRARSAAQVGGAAAVGVEGNHDSGRVSPTGDTHVASAGSTADRLRLSAADSPEASLDASVSEQHAIKEAEQRLQTLQGNISALTQASAQSGTSAASTAGQPENTGTAQATSVVADPSTQSSPPTTRSPGLAADASISDPITTNTPSVSDVVPSLTASSDAASPQASQVSESSSGINASNAVAIANSNWFLDNLLVIVTAGLALIVLIIAWLLRLAGRRRADESESESDDGSEQSDVPFDPAVLAKKLDGIDLELTNNSSDRGPRV